ncbi:MAG: glycosyltransferase family 4 protein [Candidatus Omnitrophica bacterium]|nr:glycosyltransferase family 4 protein [Candidatus Omnitrophota bacterium]
MPKTNLLFIVTKLELGGAQKQLFELIQGLAQNKDFKLFLFTSQEGVLLDDFLKINGLTLRKSKCLERAINPWKDLWAIIEICRFIKKNNIKIVHTHSSKAGVLGRTAAKLAGATCIIHTVHGWPFHQYQPWYLRNLYSFLEKQAAKFSDKLIVVSHHDKEKGLRHSIGKGSQYHLIRYGINRNIFYQQPQTQTVRDEFGLRAASLLVTNISCFKPQKSPLDFIRVAGIVLQALPEVKFILIGDGMLRGRIEKLIRKLGLQEKIILPGWRTDIPRILSATDCLVLTSLWEGLPISVLEALASGCPVVATDTGGIKEVIREGKNGFLVPPKNTQALAEKLISLLKDNALRKTMSESSRNSLEDKFDLRESCARHQQLYRDLALSKGIGAASNEYFNN